MPVSDEHKVIFIHIPKNAGTAITNTLNMHDVGHHNWLYYKTKYPQKWEAYTKVSVTRNPWDRAVSCYEYAKMDNSYWHSKTGLSRAGKHLDYDLLTGKTFEECLEILKTSPKKLKHQGWTNQSDYIYCNDNLMVDCLLDINNLDSCLSKILNAKITIPKINASNNINYAAYYKTKDMIETVESHYKTDILNFNYEF